MPTNIFNDKNYYLMKNGAGKILFLLLLTCASCSSIYRFTVDIQEPAPVTLPVSAQNVLILNNTVTQPEDFKIERTVDGQPVSQNYRLSLDSMVWHTADEIAGVLNDSHFFKTVAVYQDSLRTDTEWFSIPELSPDDQSDFYNMENFDALFVIDRLLFSVKESTKLIKTAFSSGLTAFFDLQTEGIITCSMYVYGKEKPLTTFTVSDSLNVKTTIYTDSTELFKEIPESVLQELSRELGYRAAMRFIPTWQTVERTIFKGYSARMQEATGYAANRQWENAESLWTTELGKKTKPVDKAKIAFNLAVTNEMQDKLDAALEWVQKAKEQLKNVDQSNNSQEIELTDKYISVLEQRIQNNSLLDLQWGKE